MDNCLTFVENKNEDITMEEELLFETFKAEILNRAHEKNACIVEYRKANKSQNHQELCDVIKHNWVWLCKEDVINGEIIDKYAHLFESCNIVHNRNICDGEWYVYLDGDSSYSIIGNVGGECYAKNNVLVTAFGEINIIGRNKAIIEANDNVEVDCSENCRVTAYGNSKILCHGICHVEGYDDSKICLKDYATAEAYNSSLITCSDNSEVVAHYRCIVEALDESKVQASDFVQVFGSGSEILLRKFASAKIDTGKYIHACDTSRVIATNCKEVELSDNSVGYLYKKSKVKARNNSYLFCDDTVDFELYDNAVRRNYDGDIEQIMK